MPVAEFLPELLNFAPVDHELNFFLLNCRQRFEEVEIELSEPEIRIINMMGFQENFLHHRKGNFFSLAD